jgi:hypothetical protein
MIVIDRAGGCDLYHTEYLINAGTVDVFARQIAVVVVFGGDVITMERLFDTSAGLLIDSCFYGSSFGRLPKRFFFRCGGGDVLVRATYLLTG